MSDYVPITAEQVQGFVGSDVSLNGEAVEGFLKVTTEHQMGEDAVKGILGNNSAHLHKPVEYTPITQEQFKAFYPEGATLDEGSTTKFIELATGHKLGEEAVKALVGYDHSRTEAAETAGQKEWDDTQAGWKSELEKDPLLTGGDGYEKNLAKVATVLKDYGGKPGESGLNELQEALNMTGMGNHPAMGRFLMKVVAALPGEGTPATGNPPSETKSAAQTLFPNT